MHIGVDDAEALQFQKCRKTAKVKARSLTQNDWGRYGGIIETLEGPVAFDPGDQLCVGVEGEVWPAKLTDVIASYTFEAHGDDGFDIYAPKEEIREAAQIPESFTVTRRSGGIFHGKAGDYLVRHGDRLRIVKQSVFKASYAFLPEEP